MKVSRLADLYNLGAHTSNLHSRHLGIVTPWRADNTHLPCALQAIQSISLAEERTSEARDLSSLGLLGSASLSSPGLPDLSDWTQQFSSLSIQNLQGLSGEPGGLMAGPGLSEQQEPYAGQNIQTAPRKPSRLA